jgi:phenylacetate-CoA ligase
MAIHSLSDLVFYARERSEFYRELYAPLPPGEVRLEKLPVIDQEKFWSAQAGEQNRLLTGALEDGIVFKSGGTTGNPKFSIFTREEWETFTRVFGRGMSEVAIAPGDRVANIFYAGELYASFLFIHGSLERATRGALNFPLAGATAPEAIAKAIKDFSINVIAGVPTTILALAEHMLKHDLPRASVNKIIFGGESLYPDQRALLEQIFPGVALHSIGYASVDAGLLGYADSTCAPQEHRAFGDETVMEIISEDTGEVIREPGVPGRLLVTNLTRKLMPIIRYPCGDRAQWMEPEGSRDRKFLLLGRSEEGARVGPVTVYYEDAQKVLEEFRGEGDLRAFQLVVERDGGKDLLILRISRPHGTDGVSPDFDSRLISAFYRVRPMLAELVTQGKIASPRIAWVEPSAIQINPRTGKLRRILDQRK